MIQRCTNPKAAGYKYYGGRGISVDPHWLDFANFYADMGPSPGPGYTIDRINVDGHYGPGQCRWATRAEQARNRRNNRFFTLSGETLCLTDWAKRYGISVDTVGGRLRKGLDIEAALTTPPNPIFSRRKEAA